MTTVLEPGPARERVPEASDRSFGVVFAAAFALVGGWPLIHAQAPRAWALAVAAAFAIVAAARPQLLHPLNRLWLAIGRLLHRVVSPLVMGAVFFLVVTPTAWIMRARGRDLLARKRRPDLDSYWIERAPPEPAAQSMKNQF